MTSGNVRDEPVLTEPEEAQSRLGMIADGFLHHDRRIARPAEDPVVRLLAGAVRPLRMGRGTAPIEFALATRTDVPTLALGAYQKCTIALADGSRAIVSPHLADQSTPRGRALFSQTIQDFQRLYGIRVQRVLHDAHPHFPSTRWALGSGLSAAGIWHHHAHASAVAGEFQRTAPLLCFTWDGMGLGPDRTLWGGEALLGDSRRLAAGGEFSAVQAPGGESERRASPGARRSRCAGRRASHGQRAPRAAGDLLHDAYDHDVNAPITTAVGRLFDAAAALIGVCMESSFEGEAPLKLEALCKRPEEPVALPMDEDALGVWRSDWRPLLAALLDDHVSQESRAAQFHSSIGACTAGSGTGRARDDGR